MKDRKPSFWVEDFWLFLEPDERHDGRAVSFSEIVRGGMDLALSVLQDAGLSNEKVAKTPVDQLRERLEQGSTADVALAVYGVGRLLMIASDRACENGRLTLSAVDKMRRDKARCPRVPQEDWDGHIDHVPERDVEADWIAAREIAQRGQVDAFGLAVYDFTVRLTALQTMISTVGNAARGRKASANLRESRNKHSKNAAERNAPLVAAARQIQADPQTRQVHLTGCARALLAKIAVDPALQAFVKWDEKRCRDLLKKADPPLFFQVKTGKNSEWRAIRL